MKFQLLKLTVAAIIPAILLICCVTEVPAQTRSDTGKPKMARKRLPRHSPNPANVAPAKSLLPLQVAPVSIVNLAEPGYLSGEASVTVNPKQPTVIRLGLAQNAVSIIEFPAADGIYYIHEGNPKLASVFQSPTKESDRSITVYPGESFVPSRDGGAAAAISLQMRSGLVLILEFVPVSDLRKNAHRCVITYDREAVISARRTAGLAFDLGGDSSPGSPINSRAVSKLVGSLPSGESATSTERLPDQAQPLNSAYANVDAPKNSRDRKGSDRKKTEAEISSLANKKIAESLRDPKRTWDRGQNRNTVLS